MNSEPMTDEQVLAILRRLSEDYAQMYEGCIIAKATGATQLTAATPIHLEIALLRDLAASLKREAELKAKVKNCTAAGGAISIYNNVTVQYKELSWWRRLFLRIALKGLWTP